MNDSSIFDDEIVDLTINRISVNLEFIGKYIPFYIPTYGTPGSSGVDLKADIDSPMTINPNEVYLIPTGIRISMPDGLEAQIRSRSGLAVKYGAHVTHGMGTIDNDYTGELMMIMSTVKPFKVNPGDRICQMVFAKVEQVLFEVEEVSDNESRGSNGFGSTGTN